MVLTPQSTLSLCYRTMTTSQVDGIVVRGAGGGGAWGGPWLQSQGLHQDNVINFMIRGNDSQGWSAPSSHLV